MSLPPFKIFDFTLEKLAEALSNDYCLPSAVIDIPKTTDLFGYLSDIGTKRADLMGIRDAILNSVAH